MMNKIPSVLINRRFLFSDGVPCDLSSESKAKSTSQFIKKAIADINPSF